MKAYGWLSFVTSCRKLAAGHLELAVKELLSVTVCAKYLTSAYTLPLCTAHVTLD